MKLLGALTLVLGLAGASSVIAATQTIFLDVAIIFDATKVRHDCFYAGGGDAAPSGECGPYQEIEIGETYAAYHNFAGLFETDDYETYRSAEYSIFDQTCRIGTEACFGTRRNPSRYGVHQLYSLSSNSVDYHTGGDNEHSYFAFDFISGTGVHEFIDDGDTWVWGEFAITNARIFGLPSAPVSEVPLPASGLLLLSIFAVPLARKSKL
jgi:hypothetical protein